MTGKQNDHIHCPDCGCKIGYWLGHNWYLTSPFMPPPQFSVYIHGGATDYSLRLPGDVMCETCYIARRAK